MALLNIFPLQIRFVSQYILSPFHLIINTTSIEVWILALTPIINSTS